jgi:4-aminobutyrate aminotransferase
MFYYYGRYDVNSVPKIIVEPPGPKAREILEKDNELIMQSFVRWYPLVAKTGLGPIVEDVDGNVYIDFNSGIAVMNIGHNHPKVIEAINRQSKKLLHYSLTDFYYEEAVTYAKKLTEIAPISDRKKVFFSNSGAESNEGAIKVAKGYFNGRRPYIISFIGSFHGRTTGAMAISASKPVHRKSFQPMMSAVIHIPYPYPYRCPFAVDGEKCGDAVIGYLEEWIFKRVVDPEEVSAVFIEPIQGEGGYVVPPDNFLPKLRNLTRKYNILLIVDEVQSGFGRTGKWFAVQHWGVEPDIITLAKAIASGLPLGAIVGRVDVMGLPGGSHANTFGGNPVALAAANTVIDIMKEEKIIENAAKVGESIMSRLKEWISTYEIVGDVRGKGLMIGVELVKDKNSKEPAKKELVKVLSECFKRGVAVIGAGFSVIRIAPPLVISEELAHKALDIIEEVVRGVNHETVKK